MITSALNEATEGLNCDNINNSRLDCNFLNAKDQIRTSFELQGPTGVCSKWSLQINNKGKKKIIVINSYRFTSQLHTLEETGDILGAFVEVIIGQLLLKKPKRKGFGFDFVPS